MKETSIPVTPALSLHGVSFHYPGVSPNAHVPAIHSLDYLIPDGEIVGILGPNGSGKSTLLKLVARLLKPHEGSIELFGKRLDELPHAEVAKHVAFVPQETLQMFPYTLSEMVLMGRSPHHHGWGGWHWEDREDWNIVQRAMQDLDVLHLGSRSVMSVSVGERQRAVIARALAQQPRILLLDEPTAFLDLHHQLEIARILRRLNREHGLTVVLVSHDVNLASQYCDAILLLNQGRMVACGSPDSVIREDVLQEVYGCPVLVDRHPHTGCPRVSLPVEPA